MSLSLTWFLFSPQLPLASFSSLTFIMRLFFALRFFVSLFPSTESYDSSSFLFQFASLIGLIALMFPSFCPFLPRSFSPQLLQVFTAGCSFPIPSFHVWHLYFSCSLPMLSTFQLGRRVHEFLNKTLIYIHSLPVLWGVNSLEHLMTGSMTSVPNIEMNVHPNDKLRRATNQYKHCSSFSGNKLCTVR